MRPTMRSAQCCNSNLKQPNENLVHLTLNPLTVNKPLNYLQCTLLAFQCYFSVYYHCIILVSLITPTSDDLIQR